MDKHNAIWEVDGGGRRNGEKSEGVWNCFTEKVIFEWGLEGKGEVCKFEHKHFGQRKYYVPEQSCEKPWFSKKEIERD